MVYIPLSQAVALAHRRLFPDEFSEAKTLHTIALAFTALMPIYRRESGRELTEPELAAERFTPASIEGLVVSRVRFEAAMETLQMESLDLARASLTMRQGLRLPRAIR